MGRIRRLPPPDKLIEYLQRYPGSAIRDIRKRVGGEIQLEQIKRALEKLIERG